MDSKYIYFVAWLQPDYYQCNHKKPIYSRILDRAFDKLFVVNPISDRNS